MCGHKLKISALYTSLQDVSNALLLAASNGNTRCVELLLQSKKKANVRTKCSRDGCNCLMKAIEGNHRSVSVFMHEFIDFHTLHGISVTRLFMKTEMYDRILNYQ